MNVLSIIYSSISLAIVIVCIIIVIVKQWSLRSAPMYYFLGLEVFIGIWILCGLLQVILSNPSDNTLSLIFIRIGVIANGLAMISTILFAHSLSKRIPLRRITFYIVFMVVGGVIAITFSNDVFTAVYDVNLEVTKSQTNLVWIICLAASVVLSGTFFLWHLIRQLSIVDDRFVLSTNFMMSGVVIAFYASIAIYALRFAIADVQKALFQAELVTTSIGSALLAVGMILGGKTALYGSSEVISINIYNEHGLNLYQGFFSTTHKMNEHLISGVATAIAAFATEIIGEEVFPREIDLGEYSLILNQQGKYAGFIACKYPTEQIHHGLKRVMENFTEEMKYEQVSKVIDKCLPYGLPIKVPIEQTYIRVE